MSTWTEQELRAVGTATELRISTRRSGGTLRPPVPIWVVRAGDDLYVRSYKGNGGAGFQRSWTAPSACSRYWPPAISAPSGSSRSAGPSPSEARPGIRRN
jgi:hypothetical protein